MKHPRQAAVVANEFTAVRAIGSVFRLRRDLTQLIKRNVLAGSGLTIEEADLLLDLYGAWQLKWTEPSADEDGFVTFADLRKSLVHSAASLSRRIGELRNAGVPLIETRKAQDGAPDASKTDAKAQAARITQKGIEKIAPVYKRYQEFSERLLAPLQEEDRLALLRINEQLIRLARWDV